MPVSEDVILHSLLKDRIKVIAYIRAIVGDHHLAEDVFQDVSMLALKSREQIESPEHLMKWLRTAARHKAINKVRDESKHAVVLDDELLASMDRKWGAYDQLASNDLTDALHECLNKLSPYARRLVDLRYTEGLTGKKLADVLNRKVQTVYVALTRVHRALSNCIRKSMQAEGGSHE